MTKDNILPVVVHTQSGALSTSTGPQRIASRMADEMLDCASGRERAQRRYRISDYEFREPDYEQIQRWARAQGLSPKTVVVKLAGSNKSSCISLATEEWHEDVVFRVKDGAIISLEWDFSIFPVSEWAWVNLLKIELFGISNAPSVLPIGLPSNLLGLNCSNCSFTQLDLYMLPNLTRFWCRHTPLTCLDLTPLTQLRMLNIGSSPITQISMPSSSELIHIFCVAIHVTQLDLTMLKALEKLICLGNGAMTHIHLPHSSHLTYISCCGSRIADLDLHRAPNLLNLNCTSNQIKQLNLTPVPNLVSLSCSGNLINELDLTPVPRLVNLRCDENVHLIGAPADLKVTHK